MTDIPYRESGAGGPIRGRLDDVARCNNDRCGRPHGRQTVCDLPFARRAGNGFNVHRDEDHGTAPLRRTRNGGAHGDDPNRHRRRHAGVVQCHCASERADTRTKQ